MRAPLEGEEGRGSGGPPTPNLPSGLQASPYPVILSLENHCSLEQQRVMARHLRTILGPMLLDRPLDGVTTSLPSPEVRSGHGGTQTRGQGDWLGGPWVLMSGSSLLSN